MTPIKGRAGSGGATETGSVAGPAAPGNAGRSSSVVPSIH